MNKQLEGVEIQWRGREGSSYNYSTFLCSSVRIEWPLLTLLDVDLVCIRSFNLDNIFGIEYNYE